MIKISIINASPKGNKSATYKMLEPLFEVVKIKNYELNYIDLSTKKIKHCLGCFACWLKTPGRCVIKDDADAVWETTKYSDYIVYACPLYFDNLTGIMKNFLDRGNPISLPKLERDENGEGIHLKRFNDGKDVKVIAISNAGFPELSHFEPLSLIYRRMARNMKAELVGEIYRAQGPLLTSDAPELKMLLTPYYSTLKNAYLEIFEFGKISSETQKKLEQPIIPIETYYSIANARIEELEKQIENNLAK